LNDPFRSARVRLRHNTARSNCPLLSPMLAAILSQIIINQEIALERRATAILRGKAGSVLSARHDAC
jgi:hypothetical protein